MFANVKNKISKAMEKVKNTLEKRKETLNKLLDTQPKMVDEYTAQISAEIIEEINQIDKSLLILFGVSQQRELLSWMKKNHHLDKTEEQINELLLDYNFEQLNCG